MEIYKLEVGSRPIVYVQYFLELQTVNIHGATPRIWGAQELYHEVVPSVPHHIKSIDLCVNTDIIDFRGYII